MPSGWSIEITGRPTHVAYMNEGINPIEAGMAIMADLKQLEAQWNAPENRHPLYRDAAHPINFNLGRIEGGEWQSSVPCQCTLGVRFSFFPGISAQDARRAQSAAKASNACWKPAIWATLLSTAFSLGSTAPSSTSARTLPGNCSA